MPTEEQLADLSERWRRARRAALVAVAGTTTVNSDRDAEDALLLKAVEQDQAELMRRAFDHSLLLGKGFAGFHKAELPPEKLPEALPRLGAPCLAGRWSMVESEPAFRVERTPCRADASAAYCDYWRESIDGLVLGITGGARHTRHQSRGHGGSHCVDVIYADPESPLRYGTLPSEMEPALASVRRLVTQFKGGAGVRFLGLSEQVLLYELVEPKGQASGCSSSGLGALAEIVKRCLARHFPELTLREISPRPVLDHNEDQRQSP